MALVRRFTSFPSIEQLDEIEAIDIIDLTPEAPVLGVGSGTLLVVAEYEDGPFAAGGDAVEFTGVYRNKGSQEVFGSEDYTTRFGGFGFTYGSTPSQNPCARQHLFEFWNGNGFLKTKFVRANRMIIARVDTSVGSVGFSPLAQILGGAGTFALAAGQQIAVTSDVGTASSTAIAAVRATVTGSAFTTSGFAGGETITLVIDGGPSVLVTFLLGDQTRAQVAARINTVLGYTAATDSGAHIVIVGQIYGTGGSVVCVDTTPGTLAAIGLAAGTTNGTGNVANLAAVTATEVATIVSATAALGAIDVEAQVTADGLLSIYRSLGPGTISIASSAMAIALELSPLGTVITAGEHDAGTIPAGTRVSDSGTGTAWVTMQTLTIAAGTAASPNLGPHIVKIRPALDNGSAIGAAIGDVDTVGDQPTFSTVTVTNTAVVSAALTETQMDVVYGRAYDATLDPSKIVREANYIISGRRSTTCNRNLRENVLTASANGFFGRKAIIRGALGWTVSQAIEDVALWRSDRVFYTYPGLEVQIPEIAIVGTAGGDGFTEDGVITVAADGALATIDCLLNPEENPGQATGLINQFFAVESTDTPLDIDSYKAFKRNGICAPRFDPSDGMLFQSGITTDLTTALRTQARRKMDDFISDSLARALGPYSKRLATIARRDGVEITIGGFLNNLLSPDNPSLQRIAGYLVRILVDPDRAALGQFLWTVKVRNLSSMDAIGLVVTVGEGVVTIESA